MEGDGIAEYEHRAASIRYFGININPGWVVNSSVTYGTNPIISKPYIEWNFRKVFSEYSDTYPSCHRTFLWVYLLQKGFDRDSVCTFIASACRRFDLRS